MPGDPQPGDPDGQEELAALRDHFPGWQIKRHGRGALPWDARRDTLRPPGGIAVIVADDPGHLRELLTAATAINTRHLGRLP